jgi:tRNA(Ile)-lysidine synthase
VQREDSFLVLTGRVPGSVDRARIAERESIPFHRELPVPGEVLLPAGLALTAEVAPAAETARFDDRFVAVVPKERVAGGLAVRTRRPGDRLKASAVGHRKLQDLFVDRKVPRHQRDTIPIVVDTQDRIVWVAGHALDRDFRVSDPVQAVVILRLKGVGGSF